MSFLSDCFTLVGLVLLAMQLAQLALLGLDAWGRRAGWWS